MEQYVGLDVSLELTSVCVVDSSGKTIWQGKCASVPEVIATTVRNKAPGVTRVGFESGPLSAWHWHELKKLGLPVVCLDARHAKAALSLQMNKSDRNDARGLAQIVRTGWYREVMVKSVDSQMIRTLLTTRAQLVRVPRCCRDPVLVADERAGTHIGRPIYLPWNRRLAVQISC